MKRKVGRPLGWRADMIRPYRFPVQLSEDEFGWLRARADATGQTEVQVVRELIENERHREERSESMDKIESYEMLIDTENAIAPGDGYVTTGFLEPHAIFQATGAERVDGIDYSAFKIYCAFVGSMRQWDVQDGKPWPAALMFDKWDQPMTLLQMGLDLTIQFVNTTDKPQRFAVKFVGKLKR